MYFGETVPAERVQQTRDALQRSDAMLILGSSLMVYSGFRFARLAHELGLPIASVTLGQGRADALLNLKLEQACDGALAFAFKTRV